MQAVKSAPASWIRLETASGSVEGKLFLPGGNAARLIIFQPGFPGGGASDFERWHVDRLVSAGHAVFVVRHNGTLLDGPYSSSMVDWQPRLADARSYGELHIGGDANYTVEDWLKEPMIVADALGPRFQSITFIGHSFGAACAIWSLTEMIALGSAQLGKVDQLISLAGAVGKIRLADDPQWSALLDTVESRQKVSVGGSAQNRSLLQAAYRRIHSDCAAIPAHVRFVVIHPIGDTPDSLDEVINVQEAIDLIASLSRGILLLDKTQRRRLDEGITVHALRAFPTCLLLELLESEGSLDREIRIFDA